jgi:phosphoribosylformylglycinamidine cyclo-ligase
VIDTNSWRVPPLFRLLQQNGHVPRQEMYQVFNMGIGMIAIVAPANADRVISRLKGIRIGRIERGTGRTRLLF